jgi:hypothetical protein
MTDVATLAELDSLAKERRRAAIEERQRSAEGSADRDAGPQLDALLGGGNGEAKKEANARQRARTPYSSGFCFTQQQRPELKSVQRKETNEKVSQ